MKILINDYRGDDTVINSRGDSLFDYRTHYFKKMQEDFNYWKKHGHQFICFTQHDDQSFSNFDLIVKAPRNPVANAKNYILNWIEENQIEDDWFGLWDNDATLYWNKHRSSEIPKTLDDICKIAQEQNIYAWVPFNPQQAPYQSIDNTNWTFKPTLQMKGTMTFLRNPKHYDQQRFNENITTMDDLVWAIDLTRKGHKVGTLDQSSLNELGNGKSTIFKVNAYHSEYKNPGPNANPKGLLQWDAHIDRNEKYKSAHQDVKSLYGLDWKEWQKKQRSLWKNEMFNELFEEL